MILYRISGSQKIKEGQFSDWKNCLNNYRNVFSAYLPHTIFIADNINEDILSYLQSFTSNIHKISLGNSGSFKYALNLSIHQQANEEIIYFLEDDYLHRENAPQILLEGFETGADYVSLYDHADKYQSLYTDKGWGGEHTKVLLTKSTHWKEVSSTCMTFAAKVKTLIKDHDIIMSFLHQETPQDWSMFSTLKDHGRKLVTPVPGYSTHCIKKYMSPLIDWTKYYGN